MIEVGEYIRTADGIIEKIKTFDMQTNIFVDEKGKLQKWMGETVFGDTVSDEITKHSKNIIDLIEVGDYVNGILINYMPKDEHKIYHDAYDMYDVYAFSNEDIETILTHEQYEQNCYKVGED